MKIIIDLRKYDGIIGGVEQGTLQQAKYLINNGHHAILVCKKSRLEQLSALLPDDDKLQLFPVDVETHAISEENEHIDSVVLPALAKKEKADLIHFYYNWSFPAKKTVPTVITIHDVIPFTFREAMPKDIHENLYSPSMIRSCALNDVLVTISEFSRKDISEKLGVSMDKIKVVPNGLRKPYMPSQELLLDLQKRFQLENGYILNMGGIHERKNIPRLIEAFALLRKNNNYPGVLVITGNVSGSPYVEEMKANCDRVIEKYKLKDQLVFTGFVTEPELDALLAKTDMLVYPSLYEGFGIPILEAMKLGIPVVSSNITAMPEVAGDSAILIDPYDTNDLLNGMMKILNDHKLRSQLVKSGKKRAAAYTWDATGEKYLEIYKEVINQ